MKDKCGRQVEDTCGPRNPECEGQTGDKCKIMWPKAPRVGDKCGRQVEDKCVGDKWKTSVNSWAEGTQV